MSYNSSHQNGYQPSSVQIRAARALLGISSKDLAKLSKVGWATIRRFEESDGIPPSRSGTLERVKAVLEQAGIEFLGDPLSSPGVRLHKK